MTKVIRGRSVELLSASLVYGLIGVYNSSFIWRTPYSGFTFVKCVSSSLLLKIVMTKSAIFASSFKCPLRLTRLHHAHLYGSIRVIYRPQISSSTGMGSGIVT